MIYYNLQITSNVPAAREQLQTDLGLEYGSNQYQTILSILYVGYILMRMYNWVYGFN